MEIETESEHNIPLEKRKMVRRYLLKRGVELPTDKIEADDLIDKLVTSMTFLIYMKEYADAAERWKDAISGREISHQEAIKICHELTITEIKENK